jgi:hypothetical protein
MERTLGHGLVKLRLWLNASEKAYSNGIYWRWGGGGGMFKWAEIPILILQSAITTLATQRWLDHFRRLLW